MFNAAGEVIGIVSHNISKSGGSEGLGFVVTMKTAQALLLQKKSFWGGLEGQFLTDDLADLLNVPNNMSGYLVKSVAKDLPVVLGGDIILAVEGGPPRPPRTCRRFATTWPRSRPVRPSRRRSSGRAACWS